MSWSFNFRALNKVDAIEKLNIEPQVSEYKYVPQVVVSSIEALVATLPADREMIIESNGHHMGEKGLENVTIKVGITYQENIVGAREMDVMDSTGHSKTIWDSEKPVEVEAARDLFTKLTKKGYKAFHVKDNGDEGKQMTNFDPDAEKMIMVPVIVGG